MIWHFPTRSAPYAAITVEMPLPSSTIRGGCRASPVWITWGSSSGGALYGWIRGSGPRGSITVHHGRAVHGSRPTTRANGRPLLINAYAAADAFPYHSPESYTSPHNRFAVRGERARWAHLDPEPCPMPPDYGGGAKTIYAYQSGEAAPPTPRDPGPRPAVARAGLG